MFQEKNMSIGELELTSRFHIAHKSFKNSKIEISIDPLKSLMWCTLHKNRTSVHAFQSNWIFLHLRMPNDEYTSDDKYFGKLFIKVKQFLRIVGVVDGKSVVSCKSFNTFYECNNITNISEDDSGGTSQKTKHR